MSIKIDPNINDDPYKFDTDQNGFPLFTKKNFALIEALLRYDSNYSASEDPDDPTTYAGMLAVKGVPAAFDDIYDVVKSLDKVNSTHLASEGPAGGGRGINRTVETIAQIPDLADRLRASDDSLVDEIAVAGGKNNFSFATKFCAYTCFYAQDIKSDNYCIYDRVLAEVLPYYAYLYADGDIYRQFCRTNKFGRIVSEVKLRCMDEGDYTRYRKLVDSAIMGAKAQSELQSLSYKKFDQLLWYYFKGDDRKINEALSRIEF